jgi:hypothetical protein
MRGVKNFAYDLDMIPGAVNSRVVLLLRSIEAKPWHLIFERNLPIIYSVRRVFEGVWARESRFAAERRRHEGRWIVKVRVLGENTVRLTTDLLGQIDGSQSTYPPRMLYGLGYRVL